MTFVHLFSPWAVWDKTRYPTFKSVINLGPDSEMTVVVSSKQANKDKTGARPQHETIHVTHGGDGGTKAKQVSVKQLPHMAVQTPGANGPALPVEIRMMKKMARMVFMYFKFNVDSYEELAFIYTK